MAMAYYHNDGLGYAFPTLAQLSERVRTRTGRPSNRRDIQRMLKELEGLGYLVKVRDGRGRTNGQWVVHSPPVAVRAGPAGETKPQLTFPETIAQALKDYKGFHGWKKPMSAIRIYSANPDKFYAEKAGWEAAKESGGLFSSVPSAPTESPNQRAGREHDERAVMFKRDAFLMKCINGGCPDCTATDLCPGHSKAFAEP